MYLSVFPEFCRPDVLENLQKSHGLKINQLPVTMTEKKRSTELEEVYRTNAKLMFPKGYSSDTIDELLDYLVSIGFTYEERRASQIVFRTRTKESVSKDEFVDDKCCTCGHRSSPFSLGENGHTSRKPKVIKIVVTEPVTEYSDDRVILTFCG